MLHELLIKQSLYSTYSAINKNGEGDRRNQVQKEVLKPLRTSFSNRSDFPPTHPPTHFTGPSGTPKKDPWVSPTPRGLNPRLLDPFTFLLVFSREEWENRQNWYGVPIRFGRPQAIRRGAIGAPLKVVETWLLLQRPLTSSLF